MGGGDTIEAVKRLGFKEEHFTFVSTGGGAMLEFLEGKKLPGVEVLLGKDKAPAPKKASAKPIKKSKPAAKKKPAKKKTAKKSRPKKKRK